MHGSAPGLLSLYSLFYSLPRDSFIIKNREERRYVYRDVISMDYMTIESMTLQLLRASTEVVMGGCSFWSEIDSAEFAVRTANAYPAVTMLTIAVEHWVGSSGVLLGVVTVDRADYDFGFVILGRDEHGGYRAIDANCSHATRDEARRDARRNARCHRVRRDCVSARQAVMTTSADDEIHRFDCGAVGACMPRRSQPSRASSLGARGDPPCEQRRLDIAALRIA
jgi:hypothetical protein